MEGRPAADAAQPAVADRPAGAVAPNDAAERQQRVAMEARAGELVTPRVQQSIDRGLAYLATRQRADGSIGGGGLYSKNVAVAALTGMAFLSSGSTPGQGPHGARVDRTVSFLLSCSQPTGFIIHQESTGHGPMYGHGFATLFLAEAYGMSPQPEVRDALKNAVELIINSQNAEGGWRYEPDGRDADISVTVCQIMALRAARNCGISVPKTTVDRCTDYVLKCQNPDGGFRYRLEPRPTSAFARSAAGVVALQNAGVYSGPEVQAGLDYLLRFRPRDDHFQFEQNFFYGHYYAVQAMWQTGGTAWDGWYPSIAEELVNRQGRDGGWPDSTVNSEYATAMSCLILQMPNNLLPIFQR